MFPYDAQLASVTASAPQTIPGVLQLMSAIDNACAPDDGLKWFNWLYMQVTEAVEDRVAAGGFADGAWLAALDVQFAQLYFDAIHAALTGAACAGCWSDLFTCRAQVKIARIQFALAGMNAHINHDLALAIIATCRAANITPQHGTPQYNDYTAIDSTLNSLIDLAKQTLSVRLSGDPLPAVNHLEDMFAAWNLAAAREQAWCVAEMLWSDPALVDAAMMDAIDGLTAVAGKALLVPVP